MSTLVKIQLFGTPHVLVDHQPLVRYHSQRVAALFYYLATTEATQPRQQLAELLWGGCGVSPARAGLSKGLYHLPDAVKPYVEATRNTITLRLPAAGTVDARTFTALQHRAASESVPAVRAAFLRQAADLYRGEFLQGFEVADAASFAVWLVQERQRFRQLAVDTHADLIAYHADRRAHLQAVQHATALLALDRTHEATYRQLIDLLMQLGQPEAAAAVYHTCRRVLQETLDAPPSAETIALAAQHRLQ